MLVANIILRTFGGGFSKISFWKEQKTTVNNEADENLADKKEYEENNTQALRMINLLREDGLRITLKEEIAISTNYFSNKFGQLYKLIVLLTLCLNNSYVLNPNINANCIMKL